ncbi:MAG: 1-deoxy-D-xylulose-5-phosphate reductoisomerase [Elusimicrobiota bacterium]
MKIAVLGSTGSIGKNVLSVAGSLDDIEVYGISTNRDIEGFNRQLQELAPVRGVIADSGSYARFYEKYQDGDIKTKLSVGPAGIDELVLDDEVEIVVNGLSGIAGLAPTVKALKAGKKVASANKESIVMGWELIRESLQYDGQLVPVDSEHSAVFQTLKGESMSDVVKIILTASGGAVYDRTPEELANVKLEDCLMHPTWDMGRKITIDCATLMNKGLEVIEASNLFSIDYSMIEVYIHPQSVVHGMVEYSDGTLMACMATQDMKIPIQYALTHPRRMKTPAKMLGIDDMKRLDFSLPDNDRFPCLGIAREAGMKGGIAPIVMCAADEVAVDAYADGMIKFTDIPGLISDVMQKDFTGTVGTSGTADSVEAIIEVYEKAKAVACEIRGGYIR